MPDPPDPQDRTCDVCGARATKRHEFMAKVKDAGLVGRAMFAFACDQHEWMVYLSTLPPAERGRQRKKAEGG